MRKRKKHHHLPRCVYLKHGAYYLVRDNKWTRLGKTLQEALSAYARIIEREGREAMPELIDRAHIEIIRGKAPNTIAQYNITRDRVREILREFLPEQVEPKDIAAIKLHYADRPSMGNRILSYIRLVFNLAVEWQVVRANPCTGIKRHPEQARTRYITDTEYAAIHEHASDNLRAILDIAYLTGQRISDILKIRVTDISTEGIYFRQQKTGNRLLVEMTDDLHEAISAANALTRQHQSEYLFSTMRGNGKPYAYKTVHDMYTSAASRAGVQDTGLHDIRAKSLTDADAQGLNATELAGHTTKRQTERYLRQRKTVLAKPPKMKK